MSIEIKNRLNIWEYKYPCRWYRFDEKIKTFFRKLRWMRQRAKYGWCDLDLWNLDYTLGNYIASSVNELANRTHGYPYGLDEQEWDRILREIATSFYLGTNEDVWDNPYEDKVSYKTMYSDLEKPERDVWDKFFEREEGNRKSMEIRRQEGFKVLMKWFPHLWD